MSLPNVKESGVLKGKQAGSGLQKHITVGITGKGVRGMMVYIIPSVEQPDSAMPKRPLSELMPLLCTVLSMTPTATTYAHLLGEATHQAFDGSTRSVLHDSSYAKPRC